MARGNKYTCPTCGKSYDYCPSCALTKPSYDAERYCCKNHSEIFAILSKHGCHNATAEETLEALKSYNTAGLSESIQAHIKSLQPAKVEVKAEAPAEAEKEVEVAHKKRQFRTQE